MPALLVEVEDVRPERDGPLDAVTYKKIGDFKAAVDALPNPAPPVQATMHDQVVDELRDCIRRLFDDRDEHAKTINALREQVTTLERTVGALDIRTRPLPGR